MKLQVNFCPPPQEEDAGKVLTVFGKFGNPHPVWMDPPTIMPDTAVDCNLYTIQNNTASDIEIYISSGVLVSGAGVLLGKPGDSVTVPETRSVSTYAICQWEAGVSKYRVSVNFADPSKQYTVDVTTGMSKMYDSRGEVWLVSAHDDSPLQGNEYTITIS